MLAWRKEIDAGFQEHAKWESVQQQEAKRKAREKEPVGCREFRSICTEVSNIVSSWWLRRVPQICLLSDVISSVHLQEEKLEPRSTRQFRTWPIPTTLGKNSVECSAKDATLRNAGFQRMRSFGVDTVSRPGPRLAPLWLR